MRRPVVMGNWKLNGSKAMVTELLTGINAELEGVEGVEGVDGDEAVADVDSDCCVFASEMALEILAVVSVAFFTAFFASMVLTGISSLCFSVSSPNIKVARKISFLSLSPNGASSPSWRCATLENKIADVMNKIIKKIIKIFKKLFLKKVADPNIKLSLIIL